MANLLQPSLTRATDSNGNPVSGARMYLFRSETLTPATFYLDGDGAIMGSNPVVANSVGVFPAVFLDPNIVYRLRLTDANDVVLRADVDPVRGFDESQFTALAAEVAEDRTATEAAAELAQTNAGLTQTNRLYIDSMVQLGTLRSFDSTADALSNGVWAYTITDPGSGGTDGTYDLTLTGGAGSQAAARVIVSGGVLTSVIILSRGKDYTSAPTVSFTVTGMTGGAITAAIAPNTSDGDNFVVPEDGGLNGYQNDSGVAILKAPLGLTGLNSTSTYFVGAAGNVTASGINNFAAGMFAGSSLTSGTNNTFGGYSAGVSLETGSSNTGYGASALLNATSSNNSAFGYQALFSSTTATRQTAIGIQAGFSNTTGSDNSFLGYRAGFSMTGQGGVIIGANAGFSVTADFPTLIGTEAGFNVTTASNLVAIGRRAAYGKTSGSDCTFVGTSAGFGVSSAVNTGDGITAIGAYSFGNTSTGTANTGVGRASGWYVTTGSQNAYLGFRCGYGNTTGSDNIAIGFYAGHQASTPDRTVMIGSRADYYFPDTTGLSAAGAVGGDLAEGVYAYRVTFVLDGVETAVGEPAPTFTLGSGNASFNLSGIPTYSGPRLCTARNIYRTRVGGENNFGLVATISNNVDTTLLDTLADASIGAAPVSPSDSVIVGCKARALKSGQAVFGSHDAPLTEVYFGGDIDDTTPPDVTHQSSNGSGTNVQGGDYRIAGGRGTGNAAGGRVILAAAPPGSSGTSPGSLTDWWTLDGRGFMTIAETTSASVPTPGSGKVNLFLEGGVLKYRNPAGTVLTIAAA